MVRPPAIFLRAGCVLPNALHLKQKPFGDAWLWVENASPAQLDLAVRMAGWQFVWLDAACSALGCGRTDEAAARRAIARALAQTKTKFNAAELAVLRVSRYLGFRVAKATLHTRHIQQRASFGMDEQTVRQPAPLEPSLP